MLNFKVVLKFLFVIYFFNFVSGVPLGYFMAMNEEAGLEYLAISSEVYNVVSLFLICFFGFFYMSNQCTVRPFLHGFFVVLLLLFISLILEAIFLQEVFVFGLLLDLLIMLSSLKLGIAFSLSRQNRN
ncbi:hypothetical protein CWB99_20870 [Pseudoalteromonas rubra]|uniref:Uncharacterized protein n=1 Tax=Pseudoalteromonas rubra TaxID=43658 RepID=A0A5S3WIA5_9GAMM|nr:hypothetical protein [Pseudoalteromonas rubra]TMP25622.1 hypothetical protein CWB99_20870 [Pseudoalteromonas rubra]TMP30965.1 hypothetical protein CWC00_15265 [Pseudoalteromonas rubra]